MEGGIEKKIILINFILRDWKKRITIIASLQSNSTSYLLHRDEHFEN